MRNNTVLLLDEGQAPLVHSKPSSATGFDFTGRSHAVAVPAMPKPVAPHPDVKRVPRVFVAFEGVEDPFWNFSAHTAEFFHAGLATSLIPSLMVTAMSMEWHAALRAADAADDAARRQRLEIDARARLLAQELEDEDV